MVIDVPPAAGPDDGSIDATVGPVWATYSNALSSVAVPPSVVTRTSTLPATCGGASATSLPSSIFAATTAPPISTRTDSSKCSPPTTMRTPPRVVQRNGSMEAMTGFGDTRMLRLWRSQDITEMDGEARKPGFVAGAG